MLTTRHLPPPQAVLPRNSRASIRAFWLSYWAKFFCLLPFMLLRQLVVMTGNGVAVARTWNRSVALLGGELELFFFNGLKSLVPSVIFGERFLGLRFKDRLVDPGPPFARPAMHRLAEQRSLSSVLLTHYHEEHIGNAAYLARVFGLPVYCSPRTARFLREPEVLSFARQYFIGRTEPASELPIHCIDEGEGVPGLRILRSRGHCDGHLSYYDAERGVLLVGDSFLHETFSAPNGDVDCREWIATLEKYLTLDIRTMVGCHGVVFTRDEAVPEIPGVTERRDPRALIKAKLEYLRWSRAVVAEGERRGLPYGVIEASLFPWNRPWTWRNWFNDEFIRLTSRGEFSRTHFVRSLSATPERVPVRFPWLAERTLVERPVCAHDTERCPSPRP